MFRISVPGEKEFFDRPAYLTVSGQLEAELLALGLGQVYTFGPTFRAENSNTPRHLAEFWYQQGLIAQLESIAARPFERISYTEAVKLLKASGKAFEYPCEWGADIQTEHERYLTEEKIKGPVIVFDYPAKIKPFYMRLNDDGETVAAMDVLFPRIGEIIGGSQREERLDVLRRRIQKLGLNEELYWWYLDTRRYGTVIHSGFGLGVERTLLFLSGMANIRDVIPFPRTPGSAEF
jgi:asparaginyl-tRNA synthetase